MTISRYTGGGVLACVFGSRPEQMIPYLADGLVRHVGWELIFTVGMATVAQKPLLILTPILAETLQAIFMDSSVSEIFLGENA